MKKIILASASPRRRKLLSNIGLEFEVIPSSVDEEFDEKFSNALIENLAFQKAKDVADKQTEPSVVIGSDTVVVVGDKILGKPIDENDAGEMLKMLSAKSHKVVSAIAIIDTENNKILKDSVTSIVNFRSITDSEIENYIKTGEPMDKAGAYGIQGLANVFIESIEGCYNNIVGISTYKLAQMLKEFGINVI